MKESDAIKWLDDLAVRANAVPDALASKGATSYYLAADRAVAWLAEAQSALQSIFPAGHALHSNWAAIFERAKTYKLGSVPGGLSLSESYARVHFFSALGVVQAAASLVKAGRLRSLVEGVRAETISEVLDQADALLAGRHPVAAAVLAGGALETHLLHLCQRNQLTWVGEGSIAKYDGAIAKARNDGPIEIYSATDTKQVVAWGGIRNDAAHDPTKFARTPDAVKLMVEGIRQFIARVP